MITACFLVATSLAAVGLLAAVAAFIRADDLRTGRHRPGAAPGTDRQRELYDTIVITIPAVNA